MKENSSFEDFSSFYFHEKNLFETIGSIKKVAVLVDIILFVEVLLNA